MGLRLASNQERTAIHNCSPQLGQNGMVCKSQREEVSSQARNYSIRVSPLCFDGENRPGWEMGEELRSGAGGPLRTWSPSTRSLSSGSGPAQPPRATGSLRLFRVVSVHGE